MAGVELSWFRSAKEDIEEEQRQNPPETCTNEEIKQYFMQNPRVPCLKIAQSLNYDESIIKKRLCAINLTKKLDKWFSHKLNEDNKIR